MAREVMLTTEGDVLAIDGDVVLLFRVENVGGAGGFGDFDLGRLTHPSRKVGGGHCGRW